MVPRPAVSRSPRWHEAITPDLCNLCCTRDFPPKVAVLLSIGQMCKPYGVLGELFCLAMMLPPEKRLDASPHITGTEKKPRSQSHPCLKLRPFLRRTIVV